VGKHLFPYVAFSLQLGLPKHSSVTKLIVCYRTQQHCNGCKLVITLKTILNEKVGYQFCR